MVYESLGELFLLFVVFQANWNWDWRGRGKYLAIRKGYNNNKSISGYLIVSFNSNTREHPFFRIFNLLLDIQIKLLIASR